MIIIGVDYHPSFQQIAFVETETGNYGEQRLGHPEEAETFYRGLAGHGKKVCVGMEVSGHARWFERLLEELKFELLIGDATEIESKRVRKPETDREDARLLLRLLMEDRFPRIWVASGICDNCCGPQAQTDTWASSKIAMVCSPTPSN